MDIYTIVEYVMNTPYNTNRVILVDMLYEYTEEIYSEGGEGIPEIIFLNKQKIGEQLIYFIDIKTFVPSGIYMLDSGVLLLGYPNIYYYISSLGEIYTWELDPEGIMTMTPLSSSQEKNIQRLNLQKKMILLN